MRFKIIAAVSSAAMMAVAAPALAQEAAPPAPTAAAPAPAPADPSATATPAAPAAPAAAPAPMAGASGDTYTDAQLTSFNDAMKKVSVVAESVQGGTPTAEQQAEMAAAVEASGLGIEQFNAISGAVSSDPVLQARLAVMNAPAPTAAASSVTDAEIDQFAAAMVKMREIAPEAGATPTAEQQAEMAATVEGSGLEVDRFNTIATAVSQDANLQARMRLADARRGG